MTDTTVAECTNCHGYDSSTCLFCRGTGEQPQSARGRLLDELLAGEDPTAEEYPDAVARLEGLIDAAITEGATASRTLYLAEYEGAEPALFTTPDAAREYCADFANTEARGQSWDWMPEDNGVQQQAWVDTDTDRPLHLTGGVVTTLVVDAENATTCPCHAETVHQRGCQN